MAGSNIPRTEDPENAALEYLRAQLGPRAPATVMPLGEFAETPLEGEGRTSLFTFELARAPDQPIADCDSHDPRHVVAVGETTANYFPGYGFSADDAYSFHIGTRFMLEMGLQRVGHELEPPDAQALLRKVIASVAPDPAVGELELAALFRCADGYFAVYRVSVGGETHYALGGDCPPGFYKLTQHPPQTTLRLHLGKLIRAEAAAAKRETP